MTHPRDVLVTGVTGYMGSRLAPRLVARGHRVRGLTRPGSMSRVPAGVEPIIGDPLRRPSWQEHVGRGWTFVHLIGVAHPSPAKAAQFRSVDLASAREAFAVAEESGAEHVVYVSVAQPAPAMKAYVAARAEGEALLRATGVASTVLRPWYVLGPGHWWPLALLPGYWLAELVPRTRAAARRLKPVWLEAMLGALVDAVETPPAPGTTRVVEAPEIARRARGA